MTQFLLTWALVLVQAAPRPADAAPPWVAEAREIDLESVRLRPAGTRESEAALLSFTTFATWCSACKRELPQFDALRARFGARELRLFGVAIDEKDTPAKLDAYRREHRPGYELLGELPAAERILLRQVIIKELGVGGLPATVVTRGDGRVVHVQSGVPTLSQVRRLLVAEGGR